MAYSGYSGEIPSWEMGYTRDRDVDVPNLGALLKGRAPGPVCVCVCVHACMGMFLAYRTIPGRPCEPGDLSILYVLCCVVVLLDVLRLPPIR